MAYLRPNVSEARVVSLRILEIYMSGNKFSKNGPMKSKEILKCSQQIGGPMAYLLRSGAL